MAEGAGPEPAAGRNPVTWPVIAVSHVVHWWEGGSQELENGSKHRYKNCGTHAS